VLTKNYYDNYSFAGAPSPLPNLPDSQFGVTPNVKGLQTGTWVKVLDNASSTTAEISYTLYDKKYRPVRSYTKNHLGGYTQVDTNMDWAGRTIYTITKHKRTNAATELLVKDMFTYSPQDKLLVHKQKINTLPEQLISSNTYDDLGQLTSKNVGGTDVTGAAGLQKVDYAYNIRGWLKEINKVDNLQDDLFAFKINYNDATTATKLYNGNISETFWKTSTDNVLRKYDYKYDDLNRLLQADYSKQGNTAFNSYLEHLSYDKNGNIKTLLRNGGMDTDGYQFANPIDNLTYLYDTDNKNQLLRVFDATANPQGFKDDNNGSSLITEKAQAPDYGYDANGNMTKDDNKGIQTITYNHLNLPTRITFVNGNNITYLYNASGQKVNKVVTEKIGTQNIITTTDYLNGYQYVNNILQFFPHAEGYVKVTGTSYNYVYNYTDHLGNIRLSYSKEPASNALKVIEENHYYPFGLKHTGYNSDRFVIEISPVLPRPVTKTIWRPIFEEIEFIPYNPANFNASLNYNYKYNGKEYQDELGLNMYDYGARNYDAAIGRWMNIDPLAELAYEITPNRYCYNNPLRYIDPSGLWEQTATGYTTNEPEDIKRFMSYLNMENLILNNSPTSEQTSTFIDGEMSPGGHGILSDGSTLADEIKITNYKKVGGSYKGDVDQKSFSNFWHGVQRSLTPNALDPRTVGQNLLGLTYPGGENPKTYSGKYDYSFVPQSLAEYPAIGHDRRYDNLGTAGISGLFTDTRAISSDYRFVAQELAIGVLSTNFKTKIQATILGGGLGFFASFKTITHLANPYSGGLGTILLWDSVANKGVNNYPSSK
jgi:RHS repeat-associated protein